MKFWILFFLWVMS